ncbi:periplasmic copper chaperone A [Gammaproteobacteria bacterium]
MRIHQTTYLALFCVSRLVWADAAGDIRVEDPYARASPPGAHSAVFMKLDNRAAQPHALIKVESPAARAVELHIHTMTNGLMEMRPVPRLEVPAGQPLMLEPGGSHIMLIDLTNSLSPGQNIPLTLGYEDGSQRSLVVPVRDIREPGASGSHQH